MAPVVDLRQRSRVRHRDRFALLNEPKKEPRPETGCLRHRWCLDLAIGDEQGLAATLLAHNRIYLT